ncbi:hypothetical protein SEUCBS139899_001171 [Sporothrix eucalyptigena]|uniref:Tat pathway signal sequence n=1 Tax=Sporothrix eucalyptigena TaxID=1812306 RepID=A0ABP0B588_9PEZI
MGKTVAPVSVAPVEDVIEYEVRNFQLGFGDGRTPYQAAPSPELDKLWRDLYSAGIPSLISPDAASQLENKTIPFPHDEDGRYMVSLDVFHQLHCLNMIRMALRPDHYKGHTALQDRTFSRHEDADEELFGTDHIDHCMDSIRQSLMCNADTSVLVWSWDAATRANIPHVDVAHVCKNFDKIRSWAFVHSAHDREFDATFKAANEP